MKVGDLVKVKTKCYGEKTGVVVKHGMDGYFVRPVDHPRMIIATAEDLKLIASK